MALSASIRLDAARRLMAEGRQEEAGRLADDILCDAPGNLDAALLKGAVLLAQGDRERAFLLFGRLAEEAPARGDIAANLGLLHRLEDRGEEARLCYERAVDLAPEEGTYRCALVSILLSLGDLDAARAQLRILAHLPSVLTDLTLQAEVFGLDARVALLENRPAAAERAARRALEARPEHEEDLVLLSEALSQQARPFEALEAAEAAYLRAPASHERVCLLARRLMDVGQMEEAERHLRRTAAAAPLNVEAAFLLAHLLIAKGEGEDAIARFATLVRRAPQDPDLLMRMATLLRITGNVEKALVCASQAAHAAPEGTPYGIWRDELKLALGEVQDVWPAEVKATWPTAVIVPPGLSAGEALLLARFARLSDGDGLAPVCHVEPALVPLLDGIPGLRLSVDEAPPDAVSLNELPRCTGASAAQLSAAPYLAVEARRLEAWADALAGCPRPWIGLMWDGGTGAAVGTLVSFVRDAMPKGATLLSLAFDGRRQDLTGFPDILDAGLHVKDAKDLAALIAQLDLVIATDSLAAHVAGALGRPGLVAIPPALPWAWANRDGRSLWYPSLRVVRAEKSGDLTGALAAQAAVLLEMLGVQGEGEAMTSGTP